MRKISSFLLATSLLAAPSISQASLYFSGFYGSVGVGAIWVKGKHTFADPATGKGQSKPNTAGAAGSFHLGYMTEIKTSTVMVGGEIYYMQPSFNYKMQLIPDGFPRQGAGRIQRKGTYGVSLIAGVLINPKIVVYGKLSYDIAPTQFKYSDLSFGTNRNITYKHNYKTVVPGFGFRYAIADRFHIGAEYNLAVLGKYDVRKADSAQFGAVRGIETKLTEQRIMLTFTYQITSGIGQAGSPKED